MQKTMRGLIPSIQKEFWDKFRKEFPEEKAAKAEFRSRLRNNLKIERWSTGHTSEKFAAKLEERTAKWDFTSDSDSGGPDFVWIDPVLSYFPGDISDVVRCQEFFRHKLAGVAQRNKFGLMLAMHTGKTSSDPKHRQHWTKSDYAYAMIGSSDIANWLRGCFVLQPTTDEEIVQFRCTKRWKRCDMEGLDGKKVSEIYIRHAKHPATCWIQCDKPAVPNASEKKKDEYHASQILEVMLEHKGPIGSTELQMKCEEKFGISKSTFYKPYWKKTREEEKSVVETAKGWVPAGWTPAEVKKGE